MHNIQARFKLTEVRNYRENKQPDIRNIEHRRNEELEMPNKQSTWKRSAHVQENRSTRPKRVQNRVKIGLSEGSCLTKQATELFLKKSTLHLTFSFADARRKKIATK